MDVYDLWRLRPRRYGGGNELVASVGEAPAPPAVARCDDGKRQADDGTDGDARDCSSVGFTAIIAATYVLSCSVQFAPRAALLVKRGAPVPAFFAAHRDRARAVHGDTHAGGRVRALGRTRAVDRVVVDAARGTVGARTERHAIVSSSVIAVLFA